ncbi:MAG: hypothetical protein ACJAY7_001440 [Pseudohongiellaceae bacterium]|jgi:hypothetical protein
MRFFAALLIVFVSVFTQAHEVRPAFLKLTELSISTDASSSSSTIFEASFRQPQINGRFLGLAVISNCNSDNIGASVTDSALIEVAELDCGEQGIEYIEIAGLDRTLIDALVNITWLDGSTSNRLITAQAGRLEFANELSALPVYLSVGLRHLLLGFDHIIFVLMLLYLVKSPVKLLLVISSFTAAHSLTLALSALKIVSLAPSPVEAVIAASIVLLAYENLQSKSQLSQRYPIFIAFIFGLLHGLGFASALQEIGLPENGQLIALLLFNIGIELGQLAIVAGVLLGLKLIPIRLKQELREVPIYLAGGIATFWFIERTWLIFTPLFS